MLALLAAFAVDPGGVNQSLGAAGRQRPLTAQTVIWQSKGWMAVHRGLQLS